MDTHVGFRYVRGLVFDSVGDPSMLDIKQLVSLCLLLLDNQLPMIFGYPRDMPENNMMQVPKTMVIIGGGVIGVEMATIYAALGCVPSPLWRCWIKSCR